MTRHRQINTETHTSHLPRSVDNLAYISWGLEFYEIDYGLIFILGEKGQDCPLVGAQVARGPQKSRSGTADRNAVHGDVGDECPGILVGVWAPMKAELS